MHGRPVVDRRLRLLRILARANLGGPARQLRALAPFWPELGIDEVCVTGSVPQDETELSLASSTRVASLGPGIDPASDLEALRAILRIARAFGPDLIHTHTAKAGLLGVVVGRRLGLAVVHSYHGHVLRDYFAPARERVLRRIERALARRRAGAFCVSQSCGDELVELGILDAYLHVPPAVEAPTSLAGRAELGIPSDALAVAWCGRLVGVKDPDLFAATVRELAATSPRPLFAACFGSGPMRERIESEPRITCFGPREDFPRLVGAFDVLLMTSKREGMPLAAIEALLQGVPVVGPRVPGLVDLAGPGTCLTERDAPSLAAACLRADHVPQSRRRTLGQMHDPRRVAERFAQHYRGLVDSIG